MATVLIGDAMAKKKTTLKGEPKRYGTLIRVSDEFADAIRKASALQGISMADLADKNLLAVVRGLLRETLAKETKRLG